jgi:hypothetical protein
MTEDDMRHQLEWLVRMGVMEVDRTGKEPRYRKMRRDEMTEEARRFADLLEEARGKPVGNA